MTLYSVYLLLTDLSQFNVLKVQLCYHKWQGFLLFHGHIVFHRVCVCVFSHEVMSNSFAISWTPACQALYPWDFPGKNTGVVCVYHFFKNPFIH